MMTEAQKEQIILQLEMILALLEKSDDYNEKRAADYLEHVLIYLK
jgi:hypothetical protein